MCPAGVLRTPNGVVNLRPKAKLRPRKAVALPKEEEEENKSEIKQLQEKARTYGVVIILSLYLVNNKSTMLK